MSDPNAKVVIKAVYVILKSFHRSHGISVIGWSKPPGNRYFSFYALSADPDEAIANHPLTIYQDRVGIPGWAVGREEDVLLAGSKPRRTAELLSFYRPWLRMDDYLRENAAAIEPWRATYTVGRSEPMLLTWKVMGFVANSLRWCIRTYGRSDSYSLDALEPYRRSVARFGVEDPDEHVHFCGNIAFCTDGRALLPDGRIVDFWKEHLTGVSPRELAERLLREA